MADANPRKPTEFQKGRARLARASEWQRASMDQPAGGKWAAIDNASDMIERHPNVERAKQDQSARGLNEQALA